MTGVLLIHGFAGNREELRSLQDYLGKQGFMLSMPVLAGHEGSLKELSASKYQQWIESADESYRELSVNCNRIVVIGFSMGGLIAFHMERKYKPCAIVTINTPIYYWDIARIIKNLVSDFPVYFRKYFTASTNKPLSALIEFQKLLSCTKSIIPNVTSPTLIIQAQDDDTVNPRSAGYIFRKISGQKTLKQYPTGGHLVFETAATTEISSDILNFINHAI